MMTPDKNFRMWKSSKAAIALMPGLKGSKSDFKKSVIDAQLSHEAAKRAALRSKEGKKEFGQQRGAVAPEVE